MNKVVKALIFTLIISSIILGSLIIISFTIDRVDIIIERDYNTIQERDILFNLERIAETSEYFDSVGGIIDESVFNISKIIGEYRDIEQESNRILGFIQMKHELTYHANITYYNEIHLTKLQGLYPLWYSYYNSSEADYISEFGPIDTEELDGIIANIINESSETNDFLYFLEYHMRTKREGYMHMDGIMLERLIVSDETGVPLIFISNEGMYTT